MRLYHHVLFVLLLVILGSRPIAASSQEHVQRLPPAVVTIEEDILTAFVDEPCRHFEDAEAAFAGGRLRQAANHLRIASAYFRLEAARSSATIRVMLASSVQELLNAASAVEGGDIHSVDALHQIFARAHFAMASHHCVRSAHRCSHPPASDNRGDMRLAGYDLQAAALHLSRGVKWSGHDRDSELRQLLQMSEDTSSNMIQQNVEASHDVQRLIFDLHGKLESLTGLKILLARPYSREDDRLGPSIFR